MIKRIKKVFKKTPEITMGPSTSAYEEEVGEYAGRRAIPKDPLSHLRKHFVFTEYNPISLPQKAVYSIITRPKQSVIEHLNFNF
jgi:hypothetical protein